VITATTTPLATPTTNVVSDQEPSPLNLSSITSTPPASPISNLIDPEQESPPLNVGTTTTTPLATPTTNLVSEQEFFPLDLGTIKSTPLASPMPNLVNSEQESSLLNVSITTITPLAAPTTKIVGSEQKSRPLNLEDTNEVESITPESKPVENEAVPESTPVEHDADLQTRSKRICNTCDRECLAEEMVYHCPSCYAKDNGNSTFKICYQCEAKGKLCPNNRGGDHPKLGAYILRGWYYQPVPMPDIIPSDLPIFRAIKARNAKTLASLANSGNAQTSRNSEGRTPLNLAIQLGFEDMVRVLLDAPVSLEVLDDRGLTPLMMPIKYFYLNILRMLLDEGADVNGKDNQGFTPLHMAVALKNEECLRILLEYKPIIDVVNNYGKTPLGECCFWCHIGCAQLLLDAGADPNFNYKRPGLSPLAIAVTKDDRNMIDLLLRHGAEIDVQDSAGQTPLMRAAQYGHAVASNVLIDAGARVNTADSNSLTALMLASARGQLNIVTQLLTKTNANVNLRENKRWSALTIAAKWGHVEIVEMLIKHGATGNPTPHWKWNNFDFQDPVSRSTRQKILDIVRPFKHRSEVVPPRDPRLPEKWERKVNENGKSYYVDETNAIHWKLPK
jgi:ankyrin repeat protein